MAYNSVKTWLGFENEFITDKHRNLVDFTTDKVGGTPDWPSNVSYNNLACNLCQFQRLLVLQIYAPLENSPYHRTLYLFACVNPNCHDKNKSWICLRSQILEQNIETSTKVFTKPEKSSAQWCVGQNNWDDDDEDNIDVTEENGNILANNEEQMSDNESGSFDNVEKIGFNHLQIDDRNANIGTLDEARGGVLDQLHLPQAEIHIDESDEFNFTSIETPTLPQQNLIALLNEVIPLPSFKHQGTSLQFVPFFLSFDPEESKNRFGSDDRHIDEILLKYHQQKDKKDTPDFIVSKTEDYEEDLPMHGDKMLFYFKNKIDANPGQLVRYSRTDSPLLLKPLEEVKDKCQYCGSKLTFELQVLPTIIPKLRYKNGQSTMLDFGTIIIYTCSTSCWLKDSTVHEEVLVVQTEAY